MGIAMKYFSNEEDAALCINDSFIKMCNNIGTYDDQYSFITWSRTILTRTIIDELRKTKKYKDTIVSSDKMEVLQVSEPELIIENQEEHKLIKNALNKLPKATKKVVNLYLLEGYSHSDISEMLDISTQTSKWHVKTGKKKLRELLSDYNK